MLFLSAGVMAAEQNVTNIITCSLPGEGGKEVLFFIDNVAKEINYSFKRDGKTELSVIFNEGNKLRRVKDSKMGVTYYGFKRSKYNYIIDVIEGLKKTNIQCRLISKKTKKLINLVIAYWVRSEAIVL